MKLGKYQLLAEIARGGMGIVYLAIARGPARFNKLLVIKELKPELAEEQSFLEMFLEEARLAARLSHPNIVQTYEVGSEGNRQYMVMDYLEGTTLARILRRKTKGFTLSMHLRVICEMLQGLHFAHTLTDFDGTPLGIVHRDATPQNVFVTYDGQVKLVDFGIAKAFDSTIETSTGVLKGKPAYMAPEQIRGDVDPRSDVFAAGLMVWEAIAGKRMWRQKTDVDVLTSIMKGEFPSLKEVAPDAPAELVAICERAMAWDRAERHQTALALQEDLEAYLVASKTDVSMREVAKVVAEGFSTERAALRATIDKHLGQLDSGAVPSKLPSLRPPPSADVQADGSTPVSDLTHAPTTPPVSRTPATMGTPAGTEVMSTLAVAPHQSRTPKLPLLVVGAVGLLAGTAVVGVKLMSSAPEPAPASPEAPSVTVAAPPIPAAPATHEVALRVFPAKAVVSIDGVEVSNPVTRACAHGKPFTVHASMAGHVSTDRTFNCERDESVEIALTATVSPPAPPVVVRPAAPRPPVATTHPPPPAEPKTSPPPQPSPRPTSTDVSPNGGTKPNRAIETASPYGTR